MARSEGLTEVGQIMENRMLALGLTQKDLADKAGVSVPVVRRLMHTEGANYSKRTLYGVASVLDWNPVDFRRRLGGLDGQEPLKTLQAKPGDGDNLTTLGKELADAAEIIRSVAVRIEALDRHAPGAR